MSALSLGKTGIVAMAFRSAGIKTSLYFSPELNISHSGDVGLIPGLERFPWRKKWQHTPVLLPGESHGQRSLAGYSPWGFKESDMTD